MPTGLQSEMARPTNTKGAPGLGGRGLGSGHRQRGAGPTQGKQSQAGQMAKTAETQLLGADDLPCLSRSSSETPRDVTYKENTVETALGVVPTHLVTCATTLLILEKELSRIPRCLYDT